jgi:hypothetical protein
LRRSRNVRGVSLADWQVERELAAGSRAVASSLSNLTLAPVDNEQTALLLIAFSRNPCARQGYPRRGAREGEIITPSFSRNF